MRKLMEAPEELASNYQILFSFKGIGPITVAALIIYTSNFKKFDNPYKFAYYCSIASFGKRSGTSLIQNRIQAVLCILASRLRCCIRR